MAGTAETMNQFAQRLNTSPENWADVLEEFGMSVGLRRKKTQDADFVLVRTDRRRARVEPSDGLWEFETTTREKPHFIPGAGRRMTTDDLMDQLRDFAGEASLAA